MTPPPPAVVITIIGYGQPELPTNFMVPMVGAVHDRAQIEVLRGCAGLPLCQAGFLYRPMRQRSADKLNAAAPVDLCGIPATRRSA